MIVRIPLFYTKVFTERTKISLYVEDKPTLNCCDVPNKLPLYHVAVPGEEAGSQLLRQRESAARPHKAVSSPSQQQG